MNKLNNNILYIFFFIFLSIESSAVIRWTLYKDWPVSDSIILKSSSLKFSKNGFQCKVELINSSKINQQGVIACNINDFTVRETISCSAIVQEEQISSFIVEKGGSKINPNLRCVSDGNF